MSKKKKIILLVSMIAVLAIAAYINVLIISNSNKNPGDDVPTGSFFTNYRTQREATRAYEIAQLNEILQIEGDEYAQARADAMAQKLKLISIIDLELLLETMLKAQGFEDAVVSIGATTDRINVIVACDNLTREDTARIYDIIITETSTTTDFITIQSV